LAALLVDPLSDEGVVEVLVLVEAADDDPDELESELLSLLDDESLLLADLVLEDDPRLSVL
jgi:hypothetical protein